VIYIGISESDFGYITEFDPDLPGNADAGILADFIDEVQDIIDTAPEFTYAELKDM
jgi:hypothetical protein